MSSSLCTSLCFFKKKTAYEMRIRDWSADVCSSDLRPATGLGFEWHDAKVFLTRQQHHGRTPIQAANLVVCHAAHETDSGAGGTLQLDSLRAVAGELGRASCRARLCQYVEI